MSRLSAATRTRAFAEPASHGWRIPRGAARVAVFRALQLGDMLCAVPALRALRHALPESEITLVGLPWAASFVHRFRTYVDGFLEFPGYPGLPERAPDLHRLPGFLRASQARRFDLVVQMHGSGEITNPLAAALGGGAVAGFYRPGQYRPAAGRFLPYPDDEPEVRRLVHLMQFLGVAGRGEYLEFPLSEGDRDDAHRAGGHDLAGRKYACVHPGARAPERRWSPEAFARVADAIAKRGLSVVLTGSSDETTITREVADHMCAPALDVAGRTSLGGLAALIADARLLVSNDTGVSHVADALGVSSVVVYTVSDPRRWAPLDRRKHRIVLARSAPSTLERVAAEAADLLDAEGVYAA